MSGVVEESGRVPEDGSIEVVTCTGCGEACCDYRQEGPERLCILCVEVRLERRVRELEDQLTRREAMERELSQLVYDLSAALNARDAELRAFSGMVAVQGAVEIDWLHDALDGRR